MIILDEPFNGLDVDGIKWLRTLFKRLAGEGKAVIVSSHLMSEIQEVADRVVIMGQGKLLADTTIEEMNENSLSSYVYVEAEDLDNMKKVLRKTGNDQTAAFILHFQKLKTTAICILHKGLNRFKSCFYLYSPITNLLPLLKEDGKIFIGDISFETRSDLEKCRKVHQ